MESKEAHGGLIKFLFATVFVPHPGSHFAFNGRYGPISFLLPTVYECEQKNTGDRQK